MMYLIQNIVTPQALPNFDILWSFYNLIFRVIKNIAEVRLIKDLSLVVKVSELNFLKTHPFGHFHAC